MPSASVVPVTTIEMSNGHKVSGEVSKDNTEDISKVALNNETNRELYYGVDDVPPLPTAILFAIQQLMVCTTGIITDPLIVASLICGADIPQVRVGLISTVLFTCGIGTLLQTTVGIRLPLVQGASFAFIPPIEVFKSLYECPKWDTNRTDVNNVTYTLTSGYMFLPTGSNPENEWNERIAMVQGSLLAASMVQIFIGASGLVGVFVRYVGPLTVAPLTLLLSLSVVKLCVSECAKSWTSLLLMLVLIGTALYMEPIKIPVPVYSKKESRVKLARKPIFAMFPYLISIVFVWLLSALLTLFNVLPPGSGGRTDGNGLSVLSEAKWFSIPYPAQWGSIGFNLGMCLGFIAATLSSVVESIGDYHVCARVVQAPPPPSHAVNRGILIEGVGCFLGGILGGGTSLTTYSENIGAIGITRVASRRCLQISGILLICLGVCTKFGALIATIPEPMIGAQLTISLGIVGGVGLSNLQLANMSLSRNMAILGISCLLGMMIPAYIVDYPIWFPDKEVANLGFGHRLLDALLQSLSTLLRMPMFVGGLLGFILDNTVPGATRTERGLPEHRTKHSAEKTEAHREGLRVYEFPPLVMNCMAKLKCLQYVPFLPKQRKRRTTTVTNNYDVNESNRGHF